MNGNLGYDATRTFGLSGPFGWTRTAEEPTRATAVSPHGGGVARVVTSARVPSAA
ncbi:hypothetical protein ACFWGM_23115 [Streptomyces roseolus]|uniref:hypothetical protein n=1 Tax=Streptomyces roseolus TaxID=67358 RepID=UPI0036520BE6